MNEREHEWIEIVTYARAAGAASWDEASDWARSALSRVGDHATHAAVFRTVDVLAAPAGTPEEEV